MSRRLVRSMSLGVAVVLAVAAFAFFQVEWQARQAAPRIARDPAQLPAVEVGMVLGTGPLTYGRNGGVWPNIPFVYRLDAAVALWRAGKVRYLLASGKREGTYDEPSAMRAGLIERGVPASVIYCDFDGYRTLDSILRAGSIYGLKRVTIVSQEVHVERALYLAPAAGIEAWGLAAREERPGGPGLMERITLSAIATRAWWDVMAGTPARLGGRHVEIGVDAAN